MDVPTLSAANVGSDHGLVLRKLNIKINSEKLKQAPEND